MMTFESSAEGFPNGKLPDKAKSLFINANSQVSPSDLPQQPNSACNVNVPDLDLEGTITADRCVNCPGTVLSLFNLSVN